MEQGLALDLAHTVVRVGRLLVVFESWFREWSAHNRYAKH